MWLVSHAQNKCFVAWHAEWIFDVFYSCFMLARFGLNPPCEPAHMLLTVCFRFTSWTGQSTVIPRAISIVFDVTVHDVDMMSAHDLGACNPLPCQLHPNSKIVV